MHTSYVVVMMVVVWCVYDKHTYKYLLLLLLLHAEYYVKGNLSNRFGMILVVVVLGDMSTWE